MPEFSMWGPAEDGVRLSRQDSIKEFATIAEAQHVMSQTAMNQQKIAESQQLQAAMSQLTTPDGKGGPGAGGSFADLIESQALQLSRLGQPGAAAKLGAQAAQIRAHEAQAAASDALAGERQVKAETAMVERAVNIYRNVKDQKSWDQANMMFSQLFPDQNNPLAGVPYSPQNVQLMQDSLLKEKDRRELAIKDRVRQAQDRNVDSLVQYREFRKTILERNAADRERRTDALEKNGGKTGRSTPVGAPTPNDLAAAGRLLESRLDGPIADEEERKAASYQIAAEAKAILKSVPGIDMNTAMERAVTSAIKSGDFAATTSWGRAASKFVGGGKTPETAVKATKNTQFQAGRYYIGPSGKVARFDGKNFEVVEPPRTGSAAGLDEDEEE